MSDKLECFKAYDVRGRVPDQINEDIAYRIGRAYAEVVKPRSVVVGHDIRLTSEALEARVGQWPSRQRRRCIRYRFVRHRGNLFRHLSRTVFGKWMAALR